MLEGAGLGLEGARASVEGVVGQDHGDLGPFEELLTAPCAKQVLRLARQEALRLDHDDRVGAKHLLLGLARGAEEAESLGVAAWVLVDLGADRREVRWGSSANSASRSETAPGDRDPDRRTS